MAEKTVTIDQIQQAIRLHQGQKVMLDFDLASLYGVTTFNLNKAVARNRERFPSDFMLYIPAQEVSRLIFQSGISKTVSMCAKSKPFIEFARKVSAARLDPDLFRRRNNHEQLS